MDVMDTKKKLIRSTAAQIQFLVDYMSTNPNFATGEYNGPLGARQLEEEWTNLKYNLDMYGPNKSVPQWRQTWKDLKKKARHEYATKATADTETGYAPMLQKMSQVSEQVLNIIGHKSALQIGPTNTTTTTDHLYTHRRIRRPKKPKIMQTAHQGNESAALLLQKENNALLKNVTELLMERNNLLREQNCILRTRNKILKNKNRFNI